MSVFVNNCRKMIGHRGDRAIKRQNAPSYWIMLCSTSCLVKILILKSKQSFNCQILFVKIKKKIPPPAPLRQKPSDEKQNFFLIGRNSKFDDKKGVFQIKEIVIVIEVYKYH